MKIIQIFYNILHKESDLLTSCQSLTICKKISLLSVEILFFSKELLLFLKHLEKVTLVFIPSPPPIKMSFLFTHSKFDFFLRPPPFLHNVILFTDFFLKSSLCDIGVVCDRTFFRQIFLH